MGPGLTPEEVAFQVPSPAPKELERASKLYLLAILEGTTEYVVADNVCHLFLNN